MFLEFVNSDPMISSIVWMRAIHEKSFMNPTGNLPSVTHCVFFIGIRLRILTPAAGVVDREDWDSQQHCGTPGDVLVLADHSCPFGISLTFLFVTSQVKGYIPLCLTISRYDQRRFVPAVWFK